MVTQLKLLDKNPEASSHLQRSQSAVTRSWKSIAGTCPRPLTINPKLNPHDLGVQSSFFKGAYSKKMLLEGLYWEGYYLVLCTKRFNNPLGKSMRHFCGLDISLY